MPPTISDMATTEISNRVDAAGCRPIDVDERIRAGDAEVVAVAGSQPALDAHQQPGLVDSSVELIGVTRLDGDRADRAAPKQTLEGADGHHDELVLTLAEQRALALEYADHREVQAVDPDPLVDCRGGRQPREELLGDLRAENGNGTVAARLDHGKVTPRLDAERIDEGELVRASLQRGAVEVDVAVLDTAAVAGAGNDGAECGAFLAQHLGVAPLQQRIAAGHPGVELGNTLSLRTMVKMSVPCEAKIAVISASRPWMIDTTRMIELMAMTLPSTVRNARSLLAQMASRAMPTPS